MELKGKRVVLTGGASGIGKALASALNARGARVLIADIKADVLAETAVEIGGATRSIVCDVSCHSEVEALAATAVEQLGGVDIVFANAGVITSGKLINATPAEVDWIFGVNFRGVWSTATVFARLMLDQPDGGHICITGSEHSLGYQHAGAGIYTASKHAVMGLADVLRAELPEKVGVSLFCPGLVASDLSNAPRPEGLPPVQGNPEFSRRVQARAMPAAEAARHAIDGLLAGERIIVSHPHAFAAAQRRFEAIEGAFQRQAPWTEASERYNVNRVLAEVMDEVKQGN